MILGAVLMFYIFFIVRMGDAIDGFILGFLIFVSGLIIYMRRRKKKTS